MLDRSGDTAGADGAVKRIRQPRDLGIERGGFGGFLQRDQRAIGGLARLRDGFLLRRLLVAGNVELGAFLSLKQLEQFAPAFPAEMQRIAAARCRDQWRRDGLNLEALDKGAGADIVLKGVSLKH